MARHRAFFASSVLLAASLTLAACSGSKSAGEADSSSTARPLAGTAGAPAGPGDEMLGSGGPAALVADYERQCSGNEQPSRDCEILRSLLVAEVSSALEATARSVDQRGVAEALSALDLVDEPEIFIAACNVLGLFPKTPGIAEKVMPQLLENTSVLAQRAAANLLSRTPEAGVAEVGGLWLRNHSNLGMLTAYDDYPDFPAHYKAIGLPAYPNAEWFSPGDSDRSIGWSTKDAFSDVTRWFAQALHTDPMDAQQWIQQRGEQAVSAMQLDQTKIARMQQLMTKMIGGDQSVAPELEKLQKEMDQTSKDADAAAERTFDKVAMPPDSQMAQARWFVAAKKGPRVSTVVVVYPMPGIQRTAIQVAWDLTDYPSAWPKRRHEN